MYLSSSKWKRNLIICSVKFSPFKSRENCLNLVSLLSFPHQIFASVNRKTVIHKNSLQQMSVPTSDNETFAMKTSREKGMMKQDSSASGRWKVSLPIYWWCNSWAPISLTHALRIHVFASLITSAPTGRAERHKELLFLIVTRFPSGINYIEEGE